MSPERRPLAHERLKPEVQQCLAEYLELEKAFEMPPTVSLVLTSDAPHEPRLSSEDVAAAVAFQCYQPGVTAMIPRSSKAAQRVNRMTLDGGHHTTRQHVHYTWQLVGLSRSAIHDTFHGHPFYNSEQQSQRYALAKRGAYLVPTTLDARQREVFVRAADYMNQAYFELLNIIEPYVIERIKRMYPEQRFNVDRTQKRYDDKAKKIAQEIARYVLPIGQKSILFHTLSELQLLRMFRASRSSHFSDESRYVLARMIQEIATHDPGILAELDMPSQARRADALSPTDRSRYANEFDRDMQEQQSRLIDMSQESRVTLARAVRNILHAPTDSLTDEAALQMLLDPACNKMFADVYDTGILDPLTAASRQVTLTFATRLSHTADSQRQRHRMTPGATPGIDTLYTGSADYITPLVVRETPEIAALYDEILGNVYAQVTTALDLGIPPQHALTLLPNAHTVRTIETGDLYDWVHRLRQRLCLLAQEEIFFASVKQAQELARLFPEGENLFLAPCGIRKRAGTKPKCPEGDRWCGKPVYNWGLDLYSNGRLI